jgi:hypothetical protein
MLTLQTSHEALGAVYYSRAMLREAVNELRCAVELAAICFGTNHINTRKTKGTLEQYQQSMIASQGGQLNVASASQSALPGPARPKGGSRSGSPVWVLARDDFPEAFQRDKDLIHRQRTEAAA